jgi:cysteine synthase A
MRRASTASAAHVLRAARAHSIADLVGATPVVRLNRVIPASSATVWVKMESLNPGGSVKDRIALAMVRDAEASGALRPGMRVLEATSGNTGVGLAFVAAARGYACTLVMPDSMTAERRALLKAYGAELRLTPGAGGMAEAVRVAAELAAAEPGKYWYSKQFDNAANPAVHEATTARELLAQVPELDAFVAGVGTGGTVTGVARVLRARADRARPLIVAVEPESSPLLTKGVAGPNKIQGIGANFIPPILDRAAYDRVEDVSFEDAVAMARRLAREEALLSGISTGAIVHAAAKVAKELGAGKTVVAILCDTGERYLSHPLYTEAP